MSFLVVMRPANVTVVNAFPHCPRGSRHSRLFPLLPSMSHEICDGQMQLAVSYSMGTIRMQLSHAKSIQYV